MGTVYLGYDAKLDRRAAFKVMKTGIEDETLRTRFFLEARSAAKVLDFGLARLESAETTRTRGPIGSPYYMSPEQWRGARDLDRRSDLFSVAAVFYELIAYLRPFEADDVSAVMTRIVAEPHVPL